MRSDIASGHGFTNARSILVNNYLANALHSALGEKKLAVNNGAGKKACMRTATRTLPFQSVVHEKPVGAVAAQRVFCVPANHPPAPGDRMLDPDFGPVKLIKPSGGDSWSCLTERGTRLYLRPRFMKRID